MTHTTNSQITPYDAINQPEKRSRRDPEVIYGRVLFTLLFIVTICATFQTTTPTAGAPRMTSDDDFAGLVDLGDGRKLYLECRGAGSPTVILEAGAGNNGQTWDTAGLPEDTSQTAVLPGVATFTRVCVYDRPGTILDVVHHSRSDHTPMPRTTGDIVADLHALLAAAAVPGPYVLAGHSFGGLVARLYAVTYPDDVVGLVLIDAAHEDYYAAQQAVLTPEQRQEMARLERQGPPELTGYPARERIDTDASATEMREAMTTTSLRSMPVVVLTHGRPWDWPTGYPAEELEAIWMPLQEKLAALSPESCLIVATKSGHFIPGDQPELVVEAIHKVVEGVRHPATWNDLTSSCAS